MDPKISRIVAGTIYGVQPGSKRNSRQQAGSGQKFSLDQDAKDGELTTETASSPEHEHLPVSKPEAEEAGGRLDLTA